MERGIIYLNRGTGCLIRIIVSIFSLRKHYDGGITVIAIGDIPNWFTGLLKKLQVDLLPQPDVGVKALVQKASLYEISPYRLSMFLDADTIVLAPVDEYFDKIEEFGFCTGAFADWKTTGGKISRRIAAFRKILPEDTIQKALSYGGATNTGVFGFRKDSPLLPEWKKLTVKAHEAHCSRIPDELACQILLPDYKHWLAPPEWGVSVKYGKMTEDTKIIHYHGRKHCKPELSLCRFWENTYRKVLTTFPEVKELKSAHKDKRLRRYQATLSDVTIVTAVDKKYLPKLKAHYNGWMNIDLLGKKMSKYPMIVYYDRETVDPKDLDFLNARLIPWSFHYESQRGKMLSCFVLGVARDIQTPYWMKIDADVSVKPQISDCGMPLNVFEYDLYAHRWGYTKSKARTKEEHFLNTLDEWWGGDPIFPENIPPREKYRHKRIASFICMHKTEFSKECAEYLDGEMVIPSHDTTVWYIAHRTGKKIGMRKFKREFNTR